MKKHGWFMRNTALVLAFVLFLMIPVSGSYASTEDEGMGQTFAIGLFVVIVGVLAWLGLRSDMDSNAYSASLKDTPYRYPEEYAMQECLEETQAVAEHASIQVSAEGLQVAF